MNSGKITIFDTALESSNLGDQIIMDAVNPVIAELFPSMDVDRVPTHQLPGWKQRRMMRRAKMSIVGGTNLLSSNMDTYRQWKLRAHDLRHAQRVVLMGVGWWQYQESPNEFTVRFLEELLDPVFTHSARDSYSEMMLREAGIANVANTGCPTLWGLTPEHLSQIPREPGRAVITTVTDYNESPGEDRMMLQVLKECYEEVFIWGPGRTDVAYAGELVSGLRPIQRSLNSFDRFLANHESLDYVGTRLHAGIRALQFGKRTLIVAIDNRATEMSRDFGIDTIERARVGGLAEVVDGRIDASITLPQDKIADWKQQFKEDDVVVTG